MPYITKDRRELYNQLIDELSVELNLAEPDKAKGDLNYIVFSLVKRLIDKKGIRYAICNDLMGVLTCCQLEVYRRIVAPYEDKAIEKNGDV